MPHHERLTVLILLICAFLSAAMPATAADTLPDGFVDVKELIPTIHVDLRYATDDNFVGRPIDGYLVNRCILTREAAHALKQVQDELTGFGLGLKIFDAYRPQRAVDHFVRWAKDLGDTAMKSRYYPEVKKGDLFKKGYIAERSGHSRGSTVDVTIVSLTIPTYGTELDMGTRFDFFGRESWPENLSLPPDPRANRLLLRAVMMKYGFKPYSKEWWHFTLENEPYPDTYFNFPVR
jgi:zinc D-Ala-D-Ala dipeptidase